MGVFSGSPSSEDKTVKTPGHSRQLSLLTYELMNGIIKNADAYHSLPYLKMGATYVIQVLITAVISLKVMASRLNDTQTKIGCENSTVSLTCPIGSYLSIIRANYGRFSISVCNHQARQDIDTNCSSQENSTALLRKMCNKLNFCQVPVHSDVLPPVCPETPKYLEAQFQCLSHAELAKHIRQIKYHKLGENMTDVW